MFGTVKLSQSDGADEVRISAVTPSFRQNRSRPKANKLDLSGHQIVASKAFLAWL
jgi:hypothetical protein